MNELLLIGAFVGNLAVTSYRSIPAQTDSSPFFTSTNEKVRAGGCAISRDQLCSACRKLHHRCKRPDNPTKLHYGDWLSVEGYGYRQINDVMGLRVHYWIKTKQGKRNRFKTIRNSLDIWVETWNEEHAVGVRKAKVWVIRRTIYEQA